MSDPRPYRYAGKSHRPSEMAHRLVDIGRAKLQGEGMAAEDALVVMRAIASEWCDEFGGQAVNFPKELAWDGLTARDREIWNAYTGSNVPELCKQFGLCDRQVRYVVEYCRRWHKGHQQPELPGLVETTQEQAA